MPTDNILTMRSWDLLDEQWSPPDVSASFGESALGPQCRALTATLDTTRDKCAGIAADLKLSPEGKHAARKALAESGVKSTKATTARYRDPADRAIAKGLDAMPDAVRPDGAIISDAQRPFYREALLSVLLLDLRWLRDRAGDALSEIQSGAAQGDTSLMAAVSLLSDEQRLRHVGGLNKETWAEILATYWAKVDPENSAALATARLALRIILSNESTAIRHLEALCGFSPGTLSAGDAVKNLAAVTGTT